MEIKMNKKIILAAMAMGYGAAIAAPFNAYVGPKGVDFINDQMISNGVNSVSSSFPSPQKIVDAGPQFPPENSEFAKAVIEAELNGTVFDVLRTIFDGTGFTVIENTAIVDLNVRIDAKGQHIARVVDLIARNNGLDYSIDWENKVVTMRPAKVISRIYKIDLLPISRLFKDSTSSASSSGGATSSTGSTGSTVDTTGDKDPWAEVSGTIDILLKGDYYASSDKPNLVPSYLMSQATGLLTVYATERTHNKVTDFLSRLKNVVSKPIVIDVKIIEATLTDENSVGIQWDKVAQNVLAAPGIVGNTGNIYPTQNGLLAGIAGGLVTGNIPGAMSLALNTGNLNAVVNAISKQAPVNTLSEPLIYTLNNQTGLIRRGSDGYYVTGITRDIQTGTGGGAPIITLTPTWTQMFSGITLSVTPSVDSDGNIIMHIHPSITSITTNVKVFDAVQYPLAEKNTKEQDIIIKAINGGTVVIGGILSNDLSHISAGVPVLKDIPILGGLFRSSRDTSTKSELIILLKAQVVEPQDTMEFARKIRQKMEEERIKSGTIRQRLDESHKEYLLKHGEAFKGRSAKKAAAVERERQLEDKRAAAEDDRRALIKAGKEAKDLAAAKYKAKLVQEELAALEFKKEELTVASNKKRVKLLVEFNSNIVALNKLKSEVAAIKKEEKIARSLPYAEQKAALLGLSSRLIEVQNKL